MSKQNEIFDLDRQDSERELDQNIRPQLLDEYVGQSEVKENLNIFIEKF